MSEVLRDFGSALARERTKAGMSLANFAKHTAGFSKGDLRDFEAGRKVPDKLAIKKIVHCFPVLMAFEQELRHVEPLAERSRVKHKPARAAEPTRLKQLPRKHLALVRKPKVEIIKQNELPPVLLSTPLAAPLVQALRKTRAEMLTELTGMVKKRLGSHTAEDYDFTLKNDGALVVKLRVEESGSEDLVDSGCYVTVSERGAHELAVFCRAMTNGMVGTVAARVTGSLRLLEIAMMLHEAVRDRRFE